MHAHVFTIDLLPAPNMCSSGGGLRSLQIIEGLKKLGWRVTYSLPMANDAVKLYWQQLTAEERELAFDLSIKTRRPLDLLSRLCPDVAVYLWPQLFTYPRSFKRHTVNVYDANGLQNFEGALFEAAISSRKPQIRRTTANYINKLSCADIVLAGSSEQKAYWSAIHTHEADLQNPLDMTILPYSAPHPLADAGRFNIGEPTFHFAGSFLPWNTPGNWLRLTAEVVRAKGRGKIIVVGKANPMLPHAHRLNAELRQLRDEKSIEIYDELPYDSYCKLINGKGIAIDMHHRTLERELAIAIRSITFLSHGVPLITSDFSNLSAKILQHDAGWLLDPTNQAAFKSLVGDIIDGKMTQAAAKKSENAKKLARSAFDDKAGFEALRSKVERTLETKTKSSTHVAYQSEFAFYAKTKNNAPVVLILTDDHENFLSLRVRVPFDALYRRGLISGYLVVASLKVVTRVGDPERINRIDAIWVQRGAHSYVSFLEDHFHERFNFDIDDNLLITPSYRLPYSEQWNRGLKSLLVHAQNITMTTPRLVESVRNVINHQIEHKIVIAPNLTDYVFPRRFERGPEAILLASSDAFPLTTSKDAFFSAISKFATARDIPVVYVGTQANKLSDLSCKVVSTGFLDYSSYRQFLRNENVVGVAPLDNHADPVTQEFIDCKSDIKMVEFGAIGMPALYSNAAPYADSDLGCGPLVDCSDGKAICDAFDRLFDDPIRYSTMAYESVSSKRLADVVVGSSWGEAVERVRLPMSVDLDRILELIAFSRSSAGSVLVSESEFMPQDYLAMNPDLERELKATTLTAYQHYVTKGFSEGRLWFPATNQQDVVSTRSVRKFLFDQLDLVKEAERKVNNLVK